MQKKNNKFSKYLVHNEYQQGFAHDDQHHSNIEGFEKLSQFSQNPILNFRNQNAKLLIFCLIITTVFSMVEALSGYYFKSLILETDALHMLGDSAGLFIALIANQISKKPATINLTFGYGKAEALGALINCFFTIIITLFLFYEIFVRLFDSVVINAHGLFIVATIGFFVNALIIFILSINLKSLNIKAAFIHSIGDLIASLITIISGIVIYFTHFNFLDTILSFILVFILFYSNINLIKKSAIVLMSGVPDYLDYEKVGKDLSAIDGVIGIHDLHIWYMTANIVALSAHIIINKETSWDAVLLDSQKILKEKYKIEHVTLQNEVQNIYQDFICDIK